MDTFLLFGLIGFGCLILGFIGYSVTTTKIIKDQEQEIKDQEQEIEELRHNSKLKDIKIDYLEKSRAQYKEYFDSHKIKSDPLRVNPLKVTIRSTDFVSSSALDKVIKDALEASKAGLIYPTDYFSEF